LGEKNLSGGCRKGGKVFIHFMGINVITIDIFYAVYTQSCVVCWMKAPNCLANIFIEAVNVTIHLGCLFRHCHLFYSALCLLLFPKVSSLSLTFLEIIKSYNLGKCSCCIWFFLNVNLNIYFLGHSQFFCVKNSPSLGFLLCSGTQPLDFSTSMKV